MKFEDLDEKVEWEAKRVAAAFGVKEWMALASDKEWEFNGVGRGGVFVSWGVESSTAQWSGCTVGPKARASNGRDIKPWTLSCHVVRDLEDAQVWECLSHPHFNEWMAQGLYCLGFEDEGVLAQINRPLTAHEKLELRLSLPREFWPKTWVDEEAANS